MKWETKSPLLGNETVGAELDLREREIALAESIKRFKVFRYWTIGILVCSVCLVVSVLLVEPSELKCAQKLSPYSPIWNAVEFWEGNFDNNFKQASPYRGVPTLELETAWYDLTNSMGVAVDDFGISALNKSHTGLRFAESQNSSPHRRMYAATIEVFHQLHCLNLLRQGTWPIAHFNQSWEHLYPWPLDDPVSGRVHLDHCIETLRKSLMCYADVTPVLAELTADHNYGFKLDFNVHHKCRNFDKIVNYLKIHGTDVSTDKLAMGHGQR